MTTSTTTCVSSTVRRHCDSLCRSTGSTVTVEQTLTLRASARTAFPQSPKLTWLLQNVSTSDLKERVGEKNMTMHEVELSYLRNAFAAVAPDSRAATLYEELLTVLPDQSCFPVPASDSSAYEKRIEKLARTLAESGRNRYLKGVLLNGPLFSSILVSMLAHRPNPFKVQMIVACDAVCRSDSLTDDTCAHAQAFRGRIWKDSIHNCCLNIVESGVKLYKLKMAEQLGRIVDTTDLDGYIPVLTVPTAPMPLLEVR